MGVVVLRVLKTLLHSRRAHRTIQMEKPHCLETLKQMTEEKAQWFLGDSVIVFGRFFYMTFKNSIHVFVSRIWESKAGPRDRPWIYVIYDNTC